jgi:UDP-glucose 4-epimerase
MKTIILTGCAGLLGANFSRYLLNRDYKVVGIDDLSGGYEDFLPSHENFKFHKLDLESGDIGSIFKEENPDVVFHFAAYAAEGLSPFIREFNYKNNVISSTRIVNECIKHDCKLIFTSSMAVYGDQPAPFTESMIPDPVDPYGVAKYTTEMDIKLAGSQFGLRYTIVRPHNILGIYQNIWDIYRNVIGIFIKKVLDGDSMIVYGDGEQTRAFSDVKYLLPVFENMIEFYDGELFNIGADKEWTINEVAKIVQEVAKEQGYKGIIEHGEERHEVKHAHCDHTKAKEVANFTDETNVHELIKKMFVWAKDQPERESKKMVYEINKGIYSYWK